MAKLQVKVKWVKEKYEVELDLDEPVEVFKTQLYALTGVPPERQKITAGAKQITDATDLKTFGLKDKQMLMLIGTADVLAAPAEKPVFVEDLTDEQMAGAMAAGLPFGLENLGNTCYMNATMQILNNAPDLVDALGTVSGARSQFDQQQNLTVAARDLVQKMKTATAPISPMPFLMQMRTLFPQFDQRGEGGAPMQQDAEECLTQIMHTLSEKMKNADGASMIEQMFGIELETKIKCAETEEEPEVVEKEKLLKLTCHIEGSVPQVDGSSKGGTDLMTQGISKGLQGSMEKNSPTLGRMAVYNKTSKISKLPKFMIGQFVRFFWKQDTQKKAKILRPVKFPVTLDMKDFVTEEYAAKIQKYREAELKKQEEEKEAKRAKKFGDEPKKEEKKEESKKEDEKKDGGEKMDTEGDGAAAPAGAMEVEEKQEFGEDYWASYELTGVLTHQGRSADGGHYIAWIKKDNGQWYKFDDDKVMEVKEDEVKKLYGGGDWHMAYICLYKKSPVVLGSDSTRY